MASAIKRFFEKKKLDTKFKVAGSGHKLNDAGAQRPTSSGSSKPTMRKQPSNSASRAGEAALLR